MVTIALIAGANATKARVNAPTAAMIVCNGAGNPENHVANPAIPFATWVMNGSNAVIAWLKGPATDLAIAFNESLNLSAASAISVSMVAEYCPIASRPPLSIGIRFMPDLPNSSMASAVFCAPSGILANLSAKSSMIASTPRILP